MALPWWAADRRVRGLAVLGLGAELDGIPAKVTEPTLGMVRVAFWREVLEEVARGEARAHPVAQGLKAVWPSLAPAARENLILLLDETEKTLPEAEGAAAQAPEALKQALLPSLARLAADPAARLNEEAFQRLATADTGAALAEAWADVTPLEPGSAPVAGAARLASHRRSGRPRSGFRARGALFLTVLRGK